MTLVSEYSIVRFYETGGPEVLRLETASLREPEGSEVALKILGIGMTQGDAMYRSGTYLEEPKLPSGLGTEVCGEVIATGPDVSWVKVGDRVSSLSSMSINNYPSYGSYALLPEFSLVPTPSGFTDLEGAGFSLAYIPMYFALFKEAKLQAGEWLVLNAAAATTSLAACQMAKIAGARVVGLVRGREKVARLSEINAYPYDAVIDSLADDCVEQVLAITGGGCDVVLDPVGGSQSGLLSQMCTWRARIIHYGALAGAITHHSVYDLAQKYLTVKGFTIYGYTGSKKMGLHRNERAMKDAAAFLDYAVQQGMKPVIAHTFPLDQIVLAHQALQESRHIGKIVVVPDHG